MAIHQGVVSAVAQVLSKIFVPGCISDLAEQDRRLLVISVDEPLQCRDVTLLRSQLGKGTARLTYAGVDECSQQVDVLIRDGELNQLGGGVLVALLLDQSAQRFTIVGSHRPSVIGGPL